MLPSKLKLRNFMCYAEDAPPLLLDGVHIACLCGENGAGKSALLDAITWALWGEARTRNDDDLIHMGRDEMEVELEFYIASDLYRVVRKRERRGSRPGRSVLELGVSTGRGFEPLTGSIRETQARLNSILRMDYETFRNSAFLVQGRADEFTVKSPDKRKEVLAEILNLSLYDELEQAAREEGREHDQQRRVLDMSMAEARKELVARPELQERLDGIRASHTAAVAELQSSRASLQAARDKKRELDTLSRQLEELRAAEAVAANELVELRKLMTALQHEVELQKQTLAQAAQIESAFVKLQQARQRLRFLEEAGQQFLELERKRAKLEQVVARARADRESEARLALATFQQRQERAAGLQETSAKLSTTRAALAEIEGLQHSAAALQERLQSLRQSHVELESANVRLLEEGHLIKSKMEQLAQGQGACPLCGTALSEDRCAGVLQQYETEGKAKNATFRANLAKLERLKKEEQTEQARLTELENRFKREQPALQRTLGALQVRLQEAELAQNELPSLQQKLETLERDLTGEAYAQAERRALEAIAAQLTASNYDREAHAVARKEADALGLAEGRYHRLTEAKRRFPDDLSRLEQVRAQLQQRDSLAHGMRIRLQELGLQARACADATRPLPQHERAAAESAVKLDALTIELGAAQERVARLDELQGKAEELTRQHAAASEAQGVVDELARHFGRRGLQALVIEHAVPEIEEEANRLLARMTDNRMHVKLETQTELRTREGVQETLEIRIGDELGMRNYETYSGGEAYRINLALRIALSRLLARRAGAPLPTLFIDEGFGTQDPAGRDRIVDAINSIQDEFERILVITHIDELKEQFPIRIEVQKTPHGSTFWMT